MKDDDDMMFNGSDDVDISSRIEKKLENLEQSCLERYTLREEK